MGRKNLVPSPAPCLPELQYLTKLPRSVPDGKALVHNGVKPRRQLNLNGFRAWFRPDTDKTIERCVCGWAPELGPHYKVKANPLRDGSDAWTEEQWSDAYASLGATQGALALSELAVDMRTDRKGGRLRYHLRKATAGIPGRKYRDAAIKGFFWTLENQLMRGAKGFESVKDIFPPPFKSDLPLGPTRRARRLWGKS